MSKNKTIFGHVHVHANNACKYDANGNIFFTYRIPDARTGFTENWTRCFSFFSRAHFLPCLQRCWCRSSFSVLLAHWAGYMVCHGIFLPTLGVRICLRILLAGWFSIDMCENLFTFLKTLVTIMFPLFSWISCTFL